MANPVIAIALDSGSPVLIEKWIAEGKLPHLKALQDQGTYTRLTGVEWCRAEAPWTVFLTGCDGHSTGVWTTIKFDPNTYHCWQDPNNYEFTEYPLFYALGDDYRVAIVDQPKATLSPQVNGIQLLGWSGYAHMSPSYSQPPELFTQLAEEHGYQIPLQKEIKDWLNPGNIKDCQQKTKASIEYHGKIGQAILEQEPWDFFLIAFSEIHFANHWFWHLSDRTHPLYPYLGNEAEDPLLDVYQSADQAIGTLVEKAPKDANILVFSPNSVGSSHAEISSLVFLPELLYRWSFPDQVALTPRILTDSPITQYPEGTYSWVDAVWGLVSPTSPLISPQQLQAEGQTLHWQPARWYQPCWPKMRAFAFPSFDEGYIRLNVQGREANGMIQPEEYETVCTEVTDLLLELKDKRTGRPIVRQVIRTRPDIYADDSHLPFGDLVVLWQENVVTDIVEHPKYGVIGPVPFYRTGNHHSGGFLLAKGKDISGLSGGHIMDLAPTILGLMGAPIPAYMEGKPLLGKNSVSPRSVPPRTPSIPSPEAWEKTCHQLNELGLETHLLRTRNQQLEQQWYEQQAWIQELQQAKDWLEQQRNEHLAWIQELQQAKDWWETQAKNQDAVKGE